MKITPILENGSTLALVESEALLIVDVQSALDLIATVNYETGADGMILYKEAVSEDFFALHTRLAGEVLQKFVNYHMRLAIVGDFSAYNSKSLRDFIYESNQGKSVCFAATREEAAARLSGAPQE